MKTKEDACFGHVTMGCADVELNREREGHDFSRAVSGLNTPALQRLIPALTCCHGMTSEGF